MPVEEIGESDWQAKVVASEKPVMVEFVTRTCPICHAMEPIVDALGERYAGKAKVYMVYADKHPMLAGKFGIQGVPTFKMLCKGKVIGELSGGVYPAILNHLMDHAIEHGDECAQKRSRVPEIDGYA